MKEDELEFMSQMEEAEKMVDQMQAAVEVLDELRKEFDEDGLPGPGDLKDAIAAAGYELKESS